MIDDDAITRLVELHDHIKAPATPPAADALRGRRMLRRRRAVAIGVTAAAVVTVLGIVAGTTGGPRAGERIDPVQPGQEWPLERIRAEGSPEREIVTPGSGIRTRAYVVCDEPPQRSGEWGGRTVCENDPPLRVPYQHAALEVAHNGRSALFSLGANKQYSAQKFDADSVFVMDDPSGDAWGNHDQLRYRLLKPDGTEVELQLLGDLAPATPGSDVLVVDFDTAVGGLGPGWGAEVAYLVSERDRTLRPLDVPNHRPGWLYSRFWGPNTDEFLWFVDPHCRVGWATDGTFETRGLDCAPGRTQPTYIYDDGFPDGWLRPGRMVAVEESGDYLVLHVSLDHGDTWQRVQVSDEQAIPDTLRRLG